MELPWTMHHRRVLVALPAIEQPGEIRMQALIMAHDACPKIIKPCENSQENDSGKQSNFDRHSRKCKMDRSLKPGDFLRICIIHKTLYQLRLWTYTSI